MRLWLLLNDFISPQEPPPKTCITCDDTLWLCILELFRTTKNVFYAKTDMKKKKENTVQREWFSRETSFENSKNKKKLYHVTVEKRKK